MWARKAKRLRSFDAYDQAVDRAAFALLAALRDHANPQFSSVQLEALRLRGVGEQGYGRRRTQAVFADISQRAADLLAAELREAGVTAEVAAEMDRILQRLLTSFSASSPSRRARRDEVAHASWPDVFRPPSGPD
jgi:hypothetical protein